MLERAVVRLLGIGRETAARQLPVSQMIADALAAHPPARAGIVSTGADLQIVGFLAVHDEFSEKSQVLRNLS
jgi:hypothetical protein